MKKEYPSVNGLKAILKILESLGINVSYIQQELIRSELQKYKLMVLKGIFDIDKDPVPLHAVEVADSKSDEKGIFIFFLNPLEFVEIVDDDGTPVSKEDLTNFEFLELLGLYISKTTPEKIEISIAPAEVLKRLEETPPKEDEIIVVNEEFTKEKGYKNNIDFN